MSISPDSQHLPATETLVVLSLFALFAIIPSYFALYNAGRKLSVIPPSTDIYLRILGISLIEPIVYKVIPALPTIERPGSIQISGKGIFKRFACSRTVVTIFFIKDS